MPMQAHYHPNNLFLTTTTTLSGLQDGRSTITMPTMDLYPIGEPATNANTMHGFSDGSPAALYHPDHEYPYFFDRGGPSTSISGLHPGQHATGMPESENPCSSSSAFTYPAEEIAPYQQTWLPPSIHPNSHSTSSIPESPLASTFDLSANSAFKSTLTHVDAGLNPTPSQMAILMRPPGAPPDAPLVNERQPAPPLEEDFSLSRERKHACTMCHKRFDRPSTLRKHLLVHTGEKAFQCNTCGRRFGVASNLNRHVRRCILKPVNAMHSSNASTTSASPEASAPAVAASDEHSHSTERRINDASECNRSQADNPLRPTNTYTLQVSQPRTGRTTGRAAPQKRRRRAPSPSRWVPDSLRGFIFELEGICRASSVPLPPVRPSAYEERDSWDENVGIAPYHPREWDHKPQLPGPGVTLGLGLGGRDVGNLGLGGGREQMLGRVNVLVF